MYYVSKQMEIAGCHRLELPYDSKCRKVHGHNWIVTVYCKSRELNAEGMVVDFKDIKEFTAISTTATSTSCCRLIPRPRTSPAGYASRWTTATVWT